MIVEIVKDRKHTLGKAAVLDYDNKYTLLVRLKT
jgi:hypothetical protein